MVFVARQNYCRALLTRRTIEQVQQPNRGIRQIPFGKGFREIVAGAHAPFDDMTMESARRAAPNPATATGGLEPC